MKKKYALFVFLISLILAFINISQIPAGDEMGGIIEIFLALLYTFIVFVFTIITSYLIFLKKNLNQKIWQIIIYTLCIISVYHLTWKVCVYRVPSMSFEDVRSKQLEELNELIKKGNEILVKSKNKNYTYYVKDSTEIVNYFISFLDRNNVQLSLEKDSIYHSTFNHFFDRNLTNFDSKEESFKYRQIISKSLTLDYISYSPNKKILFVIITYNIGTNPKEANAIALIGSRQGKKITLYRHPCFRNDYGEINKKYAFYSLVCDLNKGDRPCSKGNPFKNTFWTDGYFEKVKINNEYKYLYQVNELYNQPNKRFDNTYVPRITIE
jgi:hypothetical protein